MRKYNLLWLYIQKRGKAEITLSFDEIASICGVPLDHSFLQYKKELEEYGYEVKKISMKEKMVIFREKGDI